MPRRPETAAPIAGTPVPDVGIERLLDNALAERSTRARACELLIAAHALMQPGARLVYIEPLPLSDAAAAVLDVIYGDPHCRHGLQAAVVMGGGSKEACVFAGDVARVTVTALAAWRLDVLINLLFDARLHPVVLRAVA